LKGYTFEGPPLLQHLLFKVSELQVVRWTTKAISGLFF